MTLPIQDASAAEATPRTISRKATGADKVFVSPARVVGSVVLVITGGQQQRLCIARSLAIRPRVLLIDEPCSALDPTSTRVIEETMKDVCVLPRLPGHPRRDRGARDTAAMFQGPQDQRTSDYVHGRFG